MQRAKKLTSHADSLTSKPAWVARSRIIAAKKIFTLKGRPPTRSSTFRQEECVSRRTANISRPR